MATSQNIDDQVTERLSVIWQLVARLDATTQVFKGFYRSDLTKTLQGLPVGVDDFFLSIVRDAFTDSIVGQVGCLLDTTTKTLSIEKLLDRMANSRVDDQLRWSRKTMKQLGERFEEIKVKSDSLTKARHNLVAHANDAVALGQRRLKEVTFDQTEEILNDIVTLVSDIHLIVCGTAAEPLPTCNAGHDAIEFLANCIELRSFDRRHQLRVLTSR